MSGLQMMQPQRNGEIDVDFFFFFFCTSAEDPNQQANSVVYPVVSRVASSNRLLSLIVHCIN